VDLKRDRITLDGKPLELLHDQHLIGVGARQAVRCQAQHRIQGALLGAIAEGIEAGAIQGGTRIAVILELSDDVVAASHGPGPQGRQLRANRPPRFLLLGGDARVETDPHRSASKA